MNDQERQIISDIFKRLEQTAGQSRDGDAERFINDKVRTQPYAPYAMAQALYVQEEAMKSLNQQLEQTRAENEQLQQQLHQASQSNQGGFLSSIFGGGQRQAPPPAFGRSGPPPGYGQGGPQGYPQQGGPQGSPQQGGPWGGPPPGQGGPWGGQPQAQQQAPAGGGFLRGALTTAAGVAGGMVVGNALMNAFSGQGGGHSALGNFSQSDMASMGVPQGAEGGGGFQEASFGDGGNAWGGGGSEGGGFQDASFGDGGNSWGSGGSDNGGFQDASFDDGGGDFGGDDGWT